MDFKATSRNYTCLHTKIRLLTRGAIPPLWSPLFEVIIVKSLVYYKHGAMIDKQNNDGKTALTAASLQGHAHVVDMLLRAGAQVDIQNRTGDTALYLFVPSRPCSCQLTCFLELRDPGEIEQNQLAIPLLQLHPFKAILM